MLKKKVLVYGWYGKGINNIGDSLFKKTFKHLFPNLDFTFTSKLTKTSLNSTDIVIFGGGSFLYAPINTDCDNDLLIILSTKKVFYMGVGIETEIHPIHQEVMKMACLIAPRNEDGIAKLAFTNSEVLPTPDIVYALSALINVDSKPLNKSILVFPNAELLPRWTDVHWKHAAWTYFKSEFSQFLDHLKELGYKIDFAPMCINSNMHDGGAAAEIINQMQTRNFREQLNLDSFILDIDNVESKFTDLITVISKYSMVISQRYHGAILSHMAQTPSLVLAHHDKLKNSTNSSVTVPFYEVSKNKLINAFEQTKNIKVLPIKLDRFDTLRSKVYSYIGVQCPNLSVPKMEEFK